MALAVADVARVGRGDATHSGTAVAANLMHQSTTLWNSPLWASGALVIAPPPPQVHHGGSNARMARGPPRVAPPEADEIDDGLLPVAEDDDEGNTVVEVAGYTSVGSTGYGQVNGFEFIFAGGGRLVYGEAKGRRDFLRLKERESITRVAGRTDLGRRQRGAARHGPRACLVSIMFTTSKAREAVFGLANKTRQDSTFSFFAEYRSEIVGVKTLDPRIPIVTSQGSHRARTRHCIAALFSLWRVHCVWCRSQCTRRSTCCPFGGSSTFPHLWAR